MTTPNQTAPTGSFVIGSDWGQNMTEQSVNALFMPNPFPTSFFGAIDQLRDALSKLSLDTLKMWKPLVPGSTDADFANIGSAVEKILAALLPREILMKLADFEEWVDDTFASLERVVQQVLDILRGVFVTPVNAAVQGVKDWWASITGKTQKLTPTGTIDGSAVSGSVGIAQLPAVQSIVDQVATAVNNGVSTVGQAVSTVEANIGTIVGNLLGAQQSNANNAAEIAAIKASQTGDGNSGKSGADQFNYQATGLNPTNWDTALTGAGGVRTDGNNAYWSDSGGAAATEVDRFKAVTTNTDCFIVSGVMSTLMETPIFGSDPAYNWLLGRMSADRQNYVGMRLGYDSLSLWKVVGGAAPVQIGATQAYALSQSERPALVCGVDASNLRRFRMMVGDSPIGPDIDDNSGTLSQVGPNNRQGGLRWDAAPRFGGQATPGKLAAFTIADWVQPTYVGSTARMIRASGTITSAIGSFILPNNAFNSVVFSTPDVTPNLTDGSFTVSTKGNYMVKWSASANPGNNSYLLPALYYTPSGGSNTLWETGAPAGRISTAAGDTQPFPGGEVTSIIPMNPGDKVQCGYQADNTGVTMSPRFSIVRL